MEFLLKSFRFISKFVRDSPFKGIKMLRSFVSISKAVFSGFNADLQGQALNRTVTDYKHSSSTLVDYVQKNQAKIAKQVIRYGPYPDGASKGQKGDKRNRRERKPVSDSSIKQFTPNMTANSMGANESFGHVKQARPNYFVAVQIKSPKILENAYKIQQSVIQNSIGDVQHMEIDVRKSHLTLMVMNLSDTSMVDRAVQCLEESVGDLKRNSSFSPPAIDVEGVSVFNQGSVFFAKVKPSPGLNILYCMSDVVKNNMESSGIFALGKAFNPHMTLMKVPREKPAKNAARRIEREAYAEFENMFMGSETIGSIQLCKMESNSETGYYVIHHEVFF